MDLSWQKSTFNYLNFTWTIRLGFAKCSSWSVRLSSPMRSGLWIMNFNILVLNIMCEGEKVYQVCLFHYYSWLAPLRGGEEKRWLELWGNVSSRPSCELCNDGLWLSSSTTSSIYSLCPTPHHTTPHHTTLHYTTPPYTTIHHRPHWCKIIIFHS